jgi:hypothetical protein
MDIVIDAVNKLQEVLRHSGCEDGPVVLRIDPDEVYCQYEKGACMEACFGGRTAEFVTSDPVRATTKVGFMFGAPLDSPATRGAACAILNVVTAFLCMNHNIRACPAASHAPCRQDLKKRTGSGNIFCLGTMPAVERELGRFIVPEPESADIILINGEGIIAPGTGETVEKFRNKKTILLIGPSTAGTAHLETIERFCPYGT